MPICFVTVLAMKAISTLRACMGLSVGSRIHLINGSRCLTTVLPCCAMFGNIATVIPFPLQFWSIAWKNEHSWSGWASCIKTLCKVHWVISPSMVRGNSWSTSQTLLFVICVISLMNVACSSVVGQVSLGFLFSLFVSGANNKHCPNGNIVANSAIG